MTICYDERETIMQPDVERLYTDEIRHLPAPARLELLARIANDLALTEANVAPAARSLLELEGVGAGLWEGVDAQTYVDQLRDEWEGRN
jgi:hypothetical protein